MCNDRIKRFVIIFMSVLLSSCGFHARQATDIPSPLQTLYVQTNDPRGGLAEQLTPALEALGVQLVASPKQAPFTLVVLNDTFSQTSTIMGSAQQLNSMLLMYHVQVVLRNSKGQAIVPVINLTNSANYLQNADQILGDSMALPSLQQNLYRDMAQKIIAYLGSNTVRRAL